MGHDSHLNNLSSDLLRIIRSHCYHEAREKYRSIKVDIDKVLFLRYSEMEQNCMKDKEIQKKNVFNDSTAVPRSARMEEEIYAENRDTDEYVDAQPDTQNNSPPPLGFDLLSDDEIEELGKEQSSSRNRKSKNVIKFSSSTRDRKDEESNQKEHTQILGVANNASLALRFSFSDILGRGSVSTVFNGFLHTEDSDRQTLENDDPLPVAVKKMCLPCSSGFLRSLQVMLEPPFCTLTSPYLLETFYVNIEKVNASDERRPVLEVCTVFPRATNGSIYDWILRKERLSEKEIQEVAKAMLLALDTLHDSGVVHNDLKPQNIFVFEDRDGEKEKPFSKTIQGNMLKLGDFTSLCVACSTHKIAEKLKCPKAERTILLDSLISNIPLGTATYMSPEACLGCADNTGNDVWSLGVTLFHLATGHLPWTSMEAGNPFMILNGFRTMFTRGLLFPFHGENISKTTLKERCKTSGSVCGDDSNDRPFGPILDDLDNPLLFSCELSDFVKACLTENLIARPTAKSLLTHPFLVNCSKCSWEA